MKEQIKRVMARTFDIQISDITDDAKINGIPNWDSLGHMLLMLELEAEFGVSISTDDMTNLLSLDLLDEYLKGNAPHPAPEELVSGAQD
jgi:acyl carrier protein